MIEEANKKLLGMKDLKKVVMGGRSRSERSANDPGAASAQATESGQPLQMNCSEERANRESWKHPLDFLFSCISVSVGLGNVWRFPYLCYKNGGGVFLIIYFISMLFCGIPVFLQEVAIGQYLGAGGMTIVGKICPLLKGVGIATMVMVTYYNVYYCVIVAWSLYYFVASFVSIPDLPWNTCEGWWNSDKCWMPTRFENGTSSTPPSNLTIPPVEEFWNNRVLQINEGMEYGLGMIQWELAAALLGGWLIVYLIVWRGLHQSGYIIWFTALFPYFVMITLLIKALTLDGASAGLAAYVNVDWSYFKNGETWIDAATQIFFAYSVGTGALPALGSYNKFNHNCFRDALITCVVNTCTCLTAGVLVFSILGNMAYIQNSTVEQVAQDGPGLVFLTYPELVLTLPASFIWAILFFAMLLVLGIDTEFCSVESLITGIVDNWPEKLLPHRKKIAAAICFCLFLMGLPMTTQAGMYIFQLMDFYSASGLSLLWICFFETVAISWFYGASKFAENIESMIGRKPSVFWILCWKVFAPLLMGGVFFYYLATYKPVKYGSYEYPMWAEALGLCISASSMIWVPAYAIYYVLSRPGSIMENLKNGMIPEFEREALAGPGRKSSMKKTASEIPFLESGTNGSDEQ